MAAQPVLGGMARRGEPILGLPRPDQGVAEALLGLHGRMTRCAPRRRHPAGRHDADRPRAHRRGRRRGADARRSAPPSRTSSCRPPPATTGVGLQIYTCARFGPDGLVAVAPELQTLAHGMERRPEALGAAVRRARRGAARTCRCWSPRTASPPPTTRTASGSPTRRCAACPPRSPTAPTSAATCTGACSTTSSGCSATRPTFGLVSVDRQTFARTPKPSLALAGRRGPPQRPGLTATTMTHHDDLLGKLDLPAKVRLLTGASFFGLHGDPDVGARPHGAVRRADRREGAVRDGAGLPAPEREHARQHLGRGAAARGR